MKKSLLFVVALAMLFSAAQVTFAAGRLNLLIITADDLNGDSMGWMGSKLGATPNIDSFAATAHQFRNHNVTAPICQPSRSAFMTGRVPHRNGALGFQPINPGVPTLTGVLGSNGWFTAAINKTAHMMPRTQFNWQLTLEGSGKNPALLREQFEQAMRAAATAGKPFFINANCTDPHRPFAGSAQAGDGDGDEESPAQKKGGKKNQAAAASVKMFSDAEVVVPSFLEDIPPVRKEVAQYFSSVRRLDQSFGEIIAALKSAGHLEDTVIVFLGDHGMSFPYSKATLYRNGTWTPLLLRVPGAKPVANTDMVSSVDIMPTVLELLGVKAPGGLDGVSWLPLLRGEKQSGRDHVITHVNTVSSGKSFPGRCIRTATRAYIWNAWPDGKTAFRVEAMSGLSWAAMAKAAESDAKIKPRVQHFLYRCAEEFYDEANDPDERRNLINAPEHQAEIARMKKLLLAHMEKTSDPLLEQVRGGKSSTPSFAAKSIGGDEVTGGARAVVVDESAALAHTAQVFPVNRRGRMVPAANVARQTTVVLDNLDTLLASVGYGSGLRRIVKLNVYLANDSAMPTVRAALAEKFDSASKPAVSYVVGELAEPGAVVAMDAVATSEFHNSAAMRAAAPDEAGIIGVTVAAGGAPKLYISGMADTNSLLPATQKTLEKLTAVLEQLGSRRGEILHLKVFMQPMSEAKAVREVIVKFFNGKSPPLSLVEWVSSNPTVEIELIALAKAEFINEADTVTYLNPPGAAGSKVYSRVARINHGKLIYFSGLYGTKATDGAGQVQEIFATLGDIAKEAGTDFEHLVKATYYVTDNDASNKLNDLRPKYYNPQRPPAASKAKVKNVGLPGKTVTMDMIGVTK